MKKLICKHEWKMLVEKKTSAGFVAKGFGCLKCGKVKVINPLNNLYRHITEEVYLMTETEINKIKNDR